METMMKSYEIQIDGHPFRVWAEKVGKTLWYHYNGETFMFQPESKQHAGTGGSGLVHRGIMAPMPGKIIKVMVSAGQSVDAGQPVLVMEAMKMEYTLEAQVSGKIDRIACAPGDQVSLGQELAHVGE